MREAGSLTDGTHGQGLVDYLLTEGIETRLDEDADPSVLWVYDDGHLARVREELERYNADPDDARYDEARGQAAAIRKKEAQDARQSRANFIDVRGRWMRGTTGSKPVTMFLIVTSIAVALGTSLGDDRGPLFQALLFDLYWQGFVAISQGEIWRLVTPIFIHFGLMHIVFNLLWLRDLGGLIEVRRGTGFLLVLVLACAVVSNVGQYLLDGPLFGGMSGVVYGLFGYVWMKSKFSPGEGLQLQPSTVTIMMVWLVLGFTGLLGPIANGAHLVGLGVGCVAGGYRRLLRR